MAGVLQFTLGLEAADFLNKAGIASEKILEIAGAGEALHKVLENVFKAFEQGAALEHLSRRTGESAGKLYQLEEAFKACGGSAESLPTMLYQMQKALGGVSEMGESTSDVFHKLGLDVNELKKAGPAEALMKIMERMGGLSQDSAAKASSMIFGRMGGAQGVQMSRSPKEFSEAFADAARQADIFDRARTAFARIHETVLSIKREFVGFWAGIAEGAAPAVQSILDWLKKIDLTSMGEKIGNWFRALTESFSSGDFGEMISLSLQAGFEQGGFYADRFITTFCTGLATALPEAISAGFQASLGIVETVGGHFFDHGAKESIAESQKTLREIESGADWTKKFNPADLAQMKKYNEDNIATHEESINDMHAGLNQSRTARATEAAKAIQEALLQGGVAAQQAWSGFGAAPTGASDSLRGKIAQIASRFGTSAASSERGGGEADVDFGRGLTHRTEGNVFEKMGFNMGGAGGPIQDVVKNTGRTADAIDQLREVILYNWSHGDTVQPGMHQPS